MLNSFSLDIYGIENPVLHGNIAAEYGFDREVITLEDPANGKIMLFEDCPSVTIHAYPGSTMEAYALEHGLNFESIR